MSAKSHKNPKVGDEISPLFIRVLEKFGCIKGLFSYKKPLSAIHASTSNNLAHFVNNSREHCSNSRFLEEPKRRTNKQNNITENNTLKVGKKDNQSIGEDQSIEVGKKQTLDVGDAQTINVGKDQKTTVKGSAKLDAKEFSVKSKQKVEFKVGGNSVKIDTAGITIKVGGNSVKLTQTGVTIKAGANSVKLDPVGVTVKGTMVKLNGSAMTEVKGGGMVKVQGGIAMIN